MRVLRRLSDEMRQRNLTQADLGELIGMSQSGISKWFRRSVELRVDDLERLAQAVGLSPTELVRDPGLEFVADLTPTELRILERIRQRPHLQDALMTLLYLDIPRQKTTKPRGLAKDVEHKRTDLDKKLQTSVAASDNDESRTP